MKEYNDRAKTFKRSWSYYNGDHDLPLKAQKDGHNDNVIVNHVEALAERITGFLLGDGIKFDAAGDDAETPTDNDISLMWQANRGAILQGNIALSGAIEGHCAVRLMPPGEFDEWPKLIRLKQSHFSAFWDALDMSRVIWYRLQHQAGGAGRRIDYVRGAMADERTIDHEADGWLEFVYETDGAQAGNMLGSNTKWTLKAFDDRPNPLPWEFPWPPIVNWQNLPDPNGYYGRSDVKSAITLNDALNFILSNAQRIIKHHADPKTVGTGFVAEELIQSQIGGFWTVANKDAKVFNLEMQSDGALVQWLLNQIVSGLWESGGMVDPQTMKDRVGDLTNFGLRVLFANAIKKTSKKRLLYSEAFELIAKYGLELAGKAVPESVATIWPDALEEDETVEVATLGQEWDRKLISTETYRDRRGYDDEKEQERINNEMGTGDVGAQILGAMNSNKPFNKGAGVPALAGEAAPSNLESTQGLNGIQIKAALDILAALTAESLTKEAATELLVAMGMDREAANLIVSSTVKLPKPEPAPVVAPATTPDAAAVLARLKRPGS